MPRHMSYVTSWFPGPWKIQDDHLHGSPGAMADMAETTCMVPDHVTDTVSEDMSLRPASQFSHTSWVPSSVATSQGSRPRRLTGSTSTTLSSRCCHFRWSSPCNESSTPRPLRRSTLPCATWPLRCSSGSAPAQARRLLLSLTPTIHFMRFGGEKMRKTNA